MTNCFPSKDSAISRAYGSLQLAKHPANADKNALPSCRTHGRLAHLNSSVVEQITTSMQKSGELHIPTICARSNMARVASSLATKKIINGHRNDIAVHSSINVALRSLNIIAERQSTSSGGVRLKRCTHQVTFGGYARPKCAAFMRG